MSCKNLCRKFEVHISRGKNCASTFYEDDLRYCSSCGDAVKMGVYLDANQMRQELDDWNERTCPCCGRTLKFRMATLPKAR